MCKASDVANFFIGLSLSDSEDYITNLKLNKLMYYAQGWSLARLGKPLFQNDIQAWKYGPVIPAIYHDYKNCGNSPITVIDESYSNDVFSGKQYSLLLDVYGEYGKYTARALTSLTHRPGTPWSRFYEEGRNAIIPKEALKEYFSSLPPMRPFGTAVISDKDILGHLDPESGHYVLPSAEDDEDDYDL